MVDPTNARNYAGIGIIKHYTMTKAELNRAVKKFAQQIKDNKIDVFSEAAKQEFNRLHDADSTFKSFTADSLRIMIVLNRSYRFTAFHNFGPAEY